MPIELRILGGARAGQTKAFEKSHIAIGRHPSNDFAFDAVKDLDVSSKHGEIREAGGVYAIYDLNSTNGTYVNGERVTRGESRPLKNGDVIGFGVHGPTMSVQIGGQATPKVNAESAREAPRSPASAEPIAATLMGRDTYEPREPREPREKHEKHEPQKPPALPPPAKPAALPRSGRGTGERIAIAVKRQTRLLRMIVVGAVVVLGGIAAGAVWFERRDAAKRDQEINDLVAANEQMSKTFQEKLQGMNDTSLTNSWKRRADSLTTSARGARNDNERAAALAALRREGDFQRKVSATDWPSIRTANDPAVVLINAELGSSAQEATGFAISTAGLIVTNQHVVEDSSGARSTRIHVKYANSRMWRPAHIVKIAPKGVDLALIQLDQPVRLGFVTLSSAVDVPVASQIMTIGYPNGTALPMEGTGNDLEAKTTLTLGTISKSITDLLQIDAYATHGSSGSPVFDAHGHVIGAVWGGPPGSNGRIVFAVPAEKISELVKGVK